MFHGYVTNNQRVNSAKAYQVQPCKTFENIFHLRKTNSPDVVPLRASERLCAHRAKALVDPRSGTLRKNDGKVPRKMMIDIS